MNEPWRVEPKVRWLVLGLVLATSAGTYWMLMDMLGI